VGISLDLGGTGDSGREITKRENIREVDRQENMTQEDVPAQQRYNKKYPCTSMLICKRFGRLTICNSEEGGGEAADCSEKLSVINA
jgi:hypothetical protein